MFLLENFQYWFELTNRVHKRLYDFVYIILILFTSSATTVKEMARRSIIIANKYISSLTVGHQTSSLGATKRLYRRYWKKKRYLAKPAETRIVYNICINAAFSFTRGIIIYWQARARHPVHARVVSLSPINVNQILTRAQRKSKNKNRFPTYTYPRKNQLIYCSSFTVSTHKQKIK